MAHSLQVATAAAMADAMAVLCERHLKQGGGDTARWWTSRHSASDAGISPVRPHAVRLRIRSRRHARVPVGGSIVRGMLHPSNAGSAPHVAKPMSSSRRAHGSCFSSCDSSSRCDRVRGPLLMCSWRTTPLPTRVSSSSETTPSCFVVDCSMAPSTRAPA